MTDRGNQLVLLRDEELHRGISDVGHEAGEEPSVRPVLLIPGSKFFERVDRHARPAEFGLEIVRIALVSVVVGANVEEDAVVPILEKVANDPLFDIAGKAVCTVLLENRGDFSRTVFAEPPVSRRVVDLRPHPGRRDKGDRGQKRHERILARRRHRNLNRSNVHGDTADPYGPGAFTVQESTTLLHEEYRSIAGKAVSSRQMRRCSATSSVMM